MCVGVERVCRKFRCVNNRYRTLLSKIVDEERRERTLYI